MNAFLTNYIRGYFFWYIAIAINLSILVYFFLLPRALFLLNNPGYSHKDIRMSAGTSDNKNVNAIAFKLAYEIKSLTPENAAIIFSDREINLTSKTAMIRILFPREVYFEHEYKILSKTKLSNLMFDLTKKKSSKYCHDNNRKIIKLIEGGWNLCH